ncbi:hypothetical protein M409DRAFT_27116 [Zasmidium cellare ATCC 36951]|uniref:NAD dependent epimerase/dehydratase n=1 Tax=Zasmidium cellare ATCC 36951 TaxID=1080233 RepID=A0A6A6C6M2_ZASCE|nr:uncharacterized protein M409DRAFT_27116 [Zasmidium cellare ATCC 36951]KAF2162493.1 hypothetical protein M409DRAFT_27116 [Zasmidium cellare ATCC 36951]
MSLWQASFSLLQTLYPIRQTNLQRRDRPLQVLCLGLSRSGTRSLYAALTTLGYQNVYHGQDVMLSRLGDIPQWIRLAHAVKTGDPNGFLNEREFDRILGECDAVTDFPCALFAEELLRLYPGAKVVLNRRRDAEGWKRSMLISMLVVSRRGLWARTVNMWHPKYAWVRLFWIHVIDTLFHAPWLLDDSAMVSDYNQHYTTLKTHCSKQNREYLEWCVEDCWLPFCSFLNKDVPNEDFPTGNNPSNPGAGANLKFPTWPEDSKRNMALAGATLVVAVMWALLELFGVRGGGSALRTAGAMVMVFVGRWVWQARGDS